MLVACSPVSNDTEKPGQLHQLFASMFKASDQYSMTFSFFDPWYRSARPLKTYLVVLSVCGRGRLNLRTTYAKTNACTLVTKDMTMKLCSAPGRMMVLVSPVTDVLEFCCLFKGRSSSSRNVSQSEACTSSSMRI